MMYAGLDNPVTDKALTHWIFRRQLHDRQHPAAGYFR